MKQKIETTIGEKMYKYVIKTRIKIVDMSLIVLFISIIGVYNSGDARTVAVEDGLIGYWSFDKNTINGNIVKDLTGNQDGQIIGHIKIVPGKFGDAIQLPGGDRTRIRVSDNIFNATLPKEEITLELWVWDEQFLEWGGYIAAAQDNGPFEKGWILGTRWDYFSFALSSDGSDDGDGLLTYLDTPGTYDTNQWYHVVGTYDGEEMKLYVNGELENTAETQSGEINYPNKIFYSIGAYKDDNEDYTHKGIVDEVRIYERALTEKEIENNMNAEGLAVEPAAKLGLTWGEIKKGIIR